MRMPLKYYECEEGRFGNKSRKRPRFFYAPDSKQTVRTGLARAINQSFVSARKPWSADNSESYNMLVSHCNPRGKTFPCR